MSKKSRNQLGEVGDRIFGFLYSTSPGWMFALGIALAAILS